MFHHSALEQAVANRYLGSPEKRVAIHRMLAKYFLDMPSSNSRRLSELPWHLQQSANLPELTSLLTDLPTLTQLMNSEFGRLEIAQYWRDIGLHNAGALYEVS